MEQLIENHYKVIIIADDRYKRFVKNYNPEITFFLGIDNIKKPGIFYKVKAMFKLGLSFLQALMILTKTKPNIVIGFGGYPSFPTILAAKLLNIKTIIHEQNRILGNANKFLAGFVDQIAISFPSILGLNQKYLAKTTYVGNPVREDISKISSAEYHHLDSDGMINILVLGGSQGAAIFSEIIPDAIALLATELRSKIKITQQTKEQDLESVRDRYYKLGVVAEIASFFEDIGDKLSKSSLVITRSGASTLFELLASTRPAILVPYPHAIGDHQLHNANYYADIGAGIRINQRDFTAELLSLQLTTILNNHDILYQYVDNAKNHQINGSKNLMKLI
jgi:UDP-N-acetylglucosamine--N-acetylmuramyl-(pentapeptide) pyrophosphoryl-undecaprenol N-acetylglucosamine transferase